MCVTEKAMMRRKSPRERRPGGGAPGVERAGQRRNVASEREGQGAGAQALQRPCPSWDACRRAETTRRCAGSSATIRARSNLLHRQRAAGGSEENVGLEGEHDQRARKISVQKHCLRLSTSLFPMCFGSKDITASFDQLLPHMIPQHLKVKCPPF